MSLRQRSYEKELLDKDGLPFSDVQKNMHELNIVNTLLGGHSITCDGVDFFLSPALQTLTIAEIGCGGGDNLTAIHRFLVKKNIAHSLTGVDIKDECIQYARTKAATDITWVCSDYRDVEWPRDKPDIIFSSLFCHHFTNEEMISQLCWLQANSRIGFFINDLHRHPVAYNAIRVLTQLFSRSQLLKHDAPLSVKRGFIKKEWRQLLADAGITRYSLQWKWAFRHLICVRHG